MDSLEKMTFSDFVTKLASGLVEFAIHLALAILVFYVGRFIISKIYKIVKSIFVRKNIDVSLSLFVLNLINIVLYFILIVTVIGILGIETSSFLALFASAGVAIGMALSGTLQNFAGGVLVLLLKPYRVGDFIEAQGFSGTVKQIQIFSTVINTPDNKQILIPNGPLSTGTINNSTKEEYRRVEWSVSLSYGDSVEKAKEAMLDIVKSDELVLIDIEAERSKDHDFGGLDAKVPAAMSKPSVVLAELGPSSIDFKVRAWVKSDDYWTVFFRMNEAFYNELPRRGFSFPYPQLDVHMKS